MHVFLTTALVLIFTPLFLTSCDSADPLSHFRLTYHTPQNQILDSDLGCKLFTPCLDVDSFDIVCLDQNVCSGSFDPEQVKDHSGELKLLKYQRDEARYGVDTETIKVKIAGELVYVEWKTLAEGNGLYISKEYRLFKQGNQTPLISGRILVTGRWGYNTGLSGDVKVVSFASDHLWLQVDSTKSEGSGYKRPMFYFDTEYGQYMVHIVLKKVVKCAIDPQGKVSVSEGHLYYRAREQDSPEEVAHYFRVSDDCLTLLDGWFEIPLEGARFTKVFASIYSGPEGTLVDRLDLD